MNPEPVAVLMVKDKTVDVYDFCEYEEAPT